MLAPVVEWSNGAESWLEYNGTCHNPAMALTQPHLSRLKCIHYAGPNMASLFGVLREIAYELRRSMREILPPSIAPMSRFATRWLRRCPKSPLFARLHGFGRGVRRVNFVDGVVMVGRGVFLIANPEWLAW